MTKEQIKSHIRDGQKHTYTLFLVPRTSTLVSRLLEEEGVLGEVSIAAFNLQFIPIADDVLSLERENSWRTVATVVQITSGLRERGDTHVSNRHITCTRVVQYVRTSSYASEVADFV